MKKNKKRNNRYLNGSQLELIGQDGSEDLGAASQLGTGLATGNPMGIIGGATQLAGSGITGSIDTMNNGYATKGQKLGTLGLNAALGPITGGLISKYTFGKKANETQAQHQGFSNNIQQRNQMLGLRNGGMINNGYSFEDGGLLNSFNTGGSHEQNPLGGIPQGMDSNGVQNTVEQGESKHGNYIFSNNPELKITKESIIGTRLPKSVIGKTPAKAAEYLSKESKERATSKILMDETNNRLEQLKVVNDTLRSNAKSRAMRNGGPINQLEGGSSLNGESEISADASNAIKYLVQNGYDYDAASKLVQSSVQMEIPVDTLISGEFDDMNEAEAINNLSVKKKQQIDGYNQQLQSAGMGLPNQNSNLVESNTPVYDPTASWEQQSMIQPKQAQAMELDPRLPKPTLSTLAEPNRDNAYNATNKFGAPSSVSGKLRTGLGYSHYEPLGDDYPNYKTNVQREFDINDPEKRKKLLDIFDVEHPMNQTPERQRWLQEIYQANPDFLNNPQELMRLATDDLEGPVHSLIKLTPPEMNPLTPRDYKLEGGLKDPGMELEIPSELIPPPPPPPKTSYDTKPEWPTYASLASGLLGFLPGPKLDKMNATTMSIGNIDPELSDEQTAVSNVNNSVRGNIGALSNVSGGSGAAQRASMMGAGMNGATATGNAFLQANNQNNSARQSANQFNIGNQASAASQNMNALNSAEQYNVGAQNALKMEMYDTRIGLAQDTLEGLSNLGMANKEDNLNDMSAYLQTGATAQTGFDPNLQLPTNKQRFWGQETVKMRNGGIIKTSLNSSGIKSSLL